MIIKKYQGKTENEAIAAAKKEMGNSVVIMNTKKIKKKGLFLFLKPQMFEITAAVEEESEQENKKEEVSQNTQIPEKKKEPADSFSDARDVIKSIAAIQSAAGDPFEKKEEKKEEAVKKPQSPMEHYQAAIQKSNEEKSAVESVMYGSTLVDRKDIRMDQQVTVEQLSESKVLEQKLENLQNLIESQLVKNEEILGDNKTEKADQKTREMQMFLKVLYNTMIDNEVDEKYANQILDELDKVTKNNMPIDYILANVYQKMILKFGRPVGIQPAEKKPKVVFFVGPTGVGKTTTIAKLASRFHVDQEKKVALLTADTYRIAAAEQLRTYANIMDVPFRVIYSKEEVQTAYEDFQGYDYILVDTAGHSHHNEVQRQNMNTFIHSLDGIAETETFLVVSATTKYRDLISIADSYSSMADIKLIFTKLDETTTFGNLLNLKLYTGAPLSYVTCGQNVPEDIDKFNPQATVKQLLKIKKPMKSGRGEEQKEEQKVVSV